jgi:hypothetical protein
MTALCPFCHESHELPPAGGAHKCPKTIAHLQLAVAVLEDLEHATMIAKNLVRRLTFARLPAARAYFPVLDTALGDAKSDFVRLMEATPVHDTAPPRRSSPADLVDDEGMRELEHVSPTLAEIVRESGIPPHLVGGPDRSSATKPFRYAPSTSDAVTPKPAEQPIPGMLAVVERGRVPMVVHEAFLFIEEDSTLGNMPIHDAYATLLGRLEALGEGEVLARCGDGHSWKAGGPDGVPTPATCATCGGSIVLIMGRTAIDVVRELAKLPVGHRLARCPAMHLWDADDETVEQLVAPDGRPRCPKCHGTAQVCIAGLPS